MPKIFEPIKIGRMEVKNRIVAAPTVVAMADEGGYVTPRLKDVYEERAKGGAGLIVVEASWVRQDGRMFSRMLNISHDYARVGLSELVEVIHQNGARAAIQIMHGGRQTLASGMQPVAPSDLNPWMGNTPRVLSTKECEELADCFAAAALRAKEAGFDAVMYHGTHGFLIQQFMSPYTNNRTDKYGDRMAWVTEMIQKTRALVGLDFPLIFRATGDEFLGDKGITLEMFTREIVPGLIKAGIDCLDVSAGVFETFENMVQPLYFPRGFLVPLAQAAKEVSNIPVVGVGRINDPKLAEKLVEDGKVDMVALCRALIADPYFPRKMMEGQYDEIRKCIACCACMPLGDKVAWCTVNPAFGREKEYRVYPALTLRKKKVLIIGGGVGGMEAARVAALRGHEVILYEKEQNLGGLVNLASALPRLYTRELHNIVEWLTGQIRKLPIKVELGKEVSLQTVEEIKPDAVIVATGSSVDIQNIPGVNRPLVLTLDDYLRGEKVGQRVAIIGAAYGSEVAVSLAREGKEVTILEKGGEEMLIAAPYIDIMRMPVLPRYIKEEKVSLLTGVEVIEIEDKKLRYMDKERKERELEVDTVILASGRRPNNELAKVLRGKVPELYEVGDCVAPRRIFTAIHDGSYFAREL